MKKKILVMFIAAGLIFCAAAVYLQQVVLPVKIKSLIVKAIEDWTHKQVLLSSLRIHMFKGLVLNDLSISDAGETLLEIKEVFCPFLIRPLFKRQIVIPVLEIKSAQAFVRRKKDDHSLNIAEFFNETPPDNDDFVLSIHKIAVTDGRINFQDDTAEPVFGKYIEHIRLITDLSSSAEIKFDFDFKLPLDVFFPFAGALEFAGKGGYDIDKKVLSVVSDMEVIRGADISKARLDLKITGDLSDIKTCSADMRFYSDLLSVYGLKFEDVILSYKQDKGIGEIEECSLSLYDGEIAAGGKIDLGAENMPYRINITAKDVNIEKLKMDTPARDRDVSGVIDAGVGIGGFLNDLSNPAGRGKISISAGKLWELNFFKGLGNFIFADQFNDIVFTDARCVFFIKDRSIAAKNVILKSRLVDITGPVKIGFDGSIEALFNIELLIERLPLGEAIKDIASSIVGRVIRNIISVKVTGTLQDPKFKPMVGAAAQEAVGNIKGILLGQ